MKIQKAISIIAITINMLAFLDIVMLGGRAGQEITLTMAAIGLGLAIIALIIKRNALGWIALATVALPALMIFT